MDGGHMDTGRARSALGRVPEKEREREALDSSIERQWRTDHECLYPAFPLHR